MDGKEPGDKIMKLKISHNTEMFAGFVLMVTGAFVLGWAVVVLIIGIVLQIHSRARYKRSHKVFHMNDLDPERQVPQIVRISGVTEPILLDVGDEITIKVLSGWVDPELVVTGTAVGHRKNEVAESNG